MGPFLCNFWFTKLEAFSCSARLLGFAKHFSTHCADGAQDRPYGHNVIAITVSRP
jgi:hypothetical protein